MARMVFPDSKFRSPTAMAGKSDLRDEQVYSSHRFGDAATGQGKVFTVPQGQSIPILGTAASVVPLHHVSYTALTTNLTKAGELGSSLGDVSVRALGITLEAARVPTFVPGTAGTDPFGVAAAGGALGYGFTGPEAIDFLSKTTFLLRIGGKKQIEGPSWQFPNMGGPTFQSLGSPAATVTAVIFLAQNGEVGYGGRKLKLPILIARTDTLEGEINIPSGSLTVGTTNTREGLVWYTLLSLIKGDVR